MQTEPQIHALPVTIWGGLGNVGASLEGDYVRVLKELAIAY